MNLEQITRAGQIQEGDPIILKTRDGIMSVQARTVIRPGVTDESDGEEVVYNRKKNHYFITSMVIGGTSWVREAHIVRA